MGTARKQSASVSYSMHEVHLDAQRCQAHLQLSSFSQ